MVKLPMYCQLFIIAHACLHQCHAHNKERSHTERLVKRSDYVLESNPSKLTLYHKSGLTPLSVRSLKEEKNRSLNVGSMDVALRLRCGGSSSILPSIDLTIVMASLGATSQLLSAIGLGAIAATQPNILDATAVKVLSRLAYNVFQPAFLLCNVVNTIATGATGGGIPKKSLLLMPIMSLVQIMIGALFSKLVVNVANLKGDEKCDSRVCMTFVNSATLPFIFAAALFKDNQGLMSDVSACLSFYLLMWSPAFWTYGRSVLLKGSNAQSTTNNTGKKTSDLMVALTKLFSPPVMGSTIGIVIGSNPLLRNAFLEDGFLSPLFRATKTLGTAYLPSAILVLSGSLIGGKSDSNTPKTKQSKSIDTTSKEFQPLRLRTVASILFARFILSPASAYLTLHLLSTYTNILPPLGTKSRAVVSFIILMEGCMPPAQNSVLILQLVGFKDRAERMAKMLTLLYVLSIIPITFLMSLALQFSNIMAF